MDQVHDIRLYRISSAPTTNEIYTYSVRRLNFEVSAERGGCLSMGRFGERLRSRCGKKRADGLRRGRAIRGHADEQRLGLGAEQTKRWPGDQTLAAMLWSSPTGLGDGGAGPGAYKGEAGHFRWEGDHYGKIAPDLSERSPTPRLTNAVVWPEKNCRPGGQFWFCRRAHWKGRFHGRPYGKALGNKTL